jgi:anti-anti-sigma regulatory factor
MEAGRELSQVMLQEQGQLLAEQLSRGVTSIHVNVSRVVNFDSQALEGLTEFDELAKSRGLEFVLVDPSDVLSLALSITGSTSASRSTGATRPRRRGKEEG